MAYEKCRYRSSNRYDKRRMDDSALSTLSELTLLGHPSYSPTH